MTAINLNTDPDEEDTQYQYIRNGVEHYLSLGKTSLGDFFDIRKANRVSKKENESSFLLSSSSSPLPPLFLPLPPLFLPPLPPLFLPPFLFPPIGL